ncbi:hypothetical protein EDB19DRAFT_1902827 [Suillus lakei]|nr:hypothetical protein EDB19DRAFT_1902827 [Suillus lakei]
MRKTLSLSETNEEALPAFESNDIDAESEDDDGNDEDQDLDADPDGTTRDFHFELRKPPSIEDARCALQELRLLLKPPCHDKTGYEDPKLPLILKERLTLMKNFLWLYTDMHNDLAAKLKLHLQSIGKYVRAQDLVDYLSIPENQAHLGFKKLISLRTAQRWMTRMGYHWKKEPQEQYLDGHEHDDIVYYRQNIFLPAWSCYQPRMRKWKKDDITLEDLEAHTEASGRCLIVWFHDESTFYANDRRKERWVHKSKHAIPLPKGEGVLLMVADFVSADHGWLCSPDGKESAQVLFKAGKARDRYFTNEEIITQATNAMDILEKYFSDEDHIFVFDNATTHLKCADDALCARKMLKSLSATWGISVKVKTSGRNAAVGPDGKPIKEKIWMMDCPMEIHSPSISQMNTRKLDGSKEQLRSLLSEDT